MNYWRGTVTKWRLFRILWRMTEHDFIKQLKELKQIKPDNSWLKSNREILSSQIMNSGAKELSIWHRLIIDVRSFTQVISQPVLVVGSLLLFVTGASAFGYLAFNRAKPNESLYIARIISEKAKLSTIFNNEEKAKMEVQFAADHAEAITEVLANADASQHSEDAVAQLNEDFNKEIDTVRTRIVSMKKTPVVATEAPAVVPKTKEEDIIMTAGNDKDNVGVQLSLGSEKDVPAVAVTPTTTASSTVKVKEPEVILNEAKVLFDNKEYDSALDKLKEVKELIK